MVVFRVGEGARCDEVYSMTLFEMGFVEFPSDVASNSIPVTFWLWELILRAYALSHILMVTLLSTAPAFIQSDGSCSRSERVQIMFVWFGGRVSHMPCSALCTMTSASLLGVSVLRDCEAQ